MIIIKPLQVNDNDAFHFDTRSAEADDFSIGILTPFNVIAFMNPLFCGNYMQGALAFGSRIWCVLICCFTITFQFNALHCTDLYRLRSTMIDTEQC